MRFFFLLFLVPFYLLAEWDSLFPLDEDPALFHHVHVISGQLCLAVEDTVLQGAYPLSLSRTYSSSGALQRGQIHKNVRAEDLKRDCLTRGAWQILPHTKLLVIFKDPSKIEKQKFSQIEFHAVEPNGATLAYKYIRKESLGNHAYYYYYQPEKKVGIYSGTLSAKSNPQNNILRLYVNKKSPGDFDLSIFPPGGGERHYEKLSKQFDLEFSGRCYYRLAWESLSSGHKLVYTYVKDQLHLLDIKNPGCTKTLSWIHFDLLKKDSPYRFKALTSDNNSILYAAQELDGLQYLREVLNNSQKSEVCSYSLGTKGQGYRLSEMVMDGQMQVKVHYYGSSKPLYQRDEKFYRKYPCVDKVQKLEAPIGPNGEMQTLAEFSYAEGRTDVRDAEGVLTRYQYHEDQITQIEYFTKQGGRHSILRFIWMDKRLKGKVLCDAENRPVFSKTFFYDDKGNVVEEVLWGQITGQATGAFGLNTDGSLSGADCIKKWYHYDSWCNITEEVEDGGMSYQYSYKEGTDLPTRKLSFHEGKILKREFFCYNEDHLLVEEIVDDGTEYDLNNLSCVHQRIIKRYERDEQGFIKAATHYYHSDSSHSECLIERHVYEYDCHHLLSKDIVYDAHGNYRYTLETEYDDRGHVTSQSTALGMKNLYRYNPQGRLIESKEVGEPQKIYTYDPMGRVRCCEEIDDENHSKISYNNYDSKGRIISQVDFLGRSTYQNYDAFGRCIRTEFPEVKDESEHVYTPCVDFTYDVCGNLSSHTNPRGEITQTEYNVFQKPTRITRADGTEVYHTYYKNGMLAKTIEPDRTEIHYAYDPFLRMTSKKVYNAQGELLSEASWIYGTFQLLSHTDEKGLTTTFSYDGSGKKIAEVASSEAGSRVTFYSYDSLGFLQRATSGDSSQVEIHDEEGHILEKWEEKGSYKENHTKFFYDDKGLLREARRITSQGEACDLFFYNSEGRLCRHEDPLHAITQFLYHPVRNDLGQLVLCKLSINALGVKTIETDDATNRLISREKQDERGNTLSLEEYFYDRAGNRSKKICTVYLNANPLKKVTYLSEYDSMGRVVKEIEAGKKITSYSYDEKGRVKTKLLPSGVCLEYRYDGLGRILSMTSSDQSVQYLYTYETNHGYKMRVDDLMNGRTFQRFYNSFGEMIEESSPLWNLSWDYDASGRNTCFTLPDSSSITREYFDGHLFTVTRRNAQGSSLYAHTYLKTDPNGHVEKERLIYDLAEVQTKHDLLERLYLQTSPWNAHQVGYDVLGRVEHIDHSLLQEKKISYDQLDQLQQEGDQTYLFDSMGNSSSYETNDCNEVLSTPDSTLSYDLNGNLIKRRLPDQTIFYSYDALGRLTSITYPRSKKITYAYDPFSRLFSREIYLWKEGGFQKDTLHFFLHDHEKEIGALNEHKELVQLKVLGLGLRGDIGAAVAIELDHEVYAPLHDYRGSCIALISSAGSIAETYQIAAFGKEQTHPASPKNPWRFSSKRQEEGLVFFGLRCYDIALERWLTPDPAGHVDGPNLYAYVLNSPLNRLDLFGLVSDQWGREHSSIFSSSPQYPTPTLASLSIAQIREAQLGQRRLLNIFEKGAKTNWFVICEHTHKLQFSAQELEIGSVKLFDHFAELYPKDGKAVGLITVQNGIYTPSQPFQQMCLSVTDKVPEGTLLLGMHNSSGTMTRTFMEKLGFPSTVIRATSQMMGAIAENLYKINPDSIWLDIRHSEGGLIGRRSIDRLTQDQKNILLKQYICLAFAPAEMMPKEYGLEVYNIFSEKDRVTGWAAQKKDKFTYNVKILECASSGSALTLWLTEHYFMGPTYQKGVRDELNVIRDDIGFYDGNTR